MFNQPTYSYWVVFSTICELKLTRHQDDLSIIGIRVRIITLIRQRLSWGFRFALSTFPSERKIFFSLATISLSKSSRKDSISLCYKFTMTPVLILPLNAEFRSLHFTLPLLPNLLIPSLFSPLLEPYFQWFENSYRCQNSCCK